MGACEERALEEQALEERALERQVLEGTCEEHALEERAVVWQTAGLNGPRTVAGLTASRTAGLHLHQSSGIIRQNKRSSFLSHPEGSVNHRIAPAH